MQRLNALWRQRRHFDFCQLAGFAMIGAAATILQHPASLAFSWFDLLYQLSMPPLTWAALFCAAGWLLAWQQHASGLRFFLLTTPILLYGVVQWIFFFTNAQAGSTAGYLTTMLFITLQYAHVRQEAWARWTKLYASS